MEQPRHAKVERVVEDGQTRLVVRGRLDRDSAPAVLDWIRAWLPRRAGKVGLDLGQVDLLDSAGVAILAESLELAAKRGCTMELVRVSAPAQRTLEMFRFADEVDAAPAESGRLLQGLGEWLISTLSSTQRLFLLMADTFYWALIGPFSSGRGAPKGELTRQTILLGSKAFGIVALMASLIGLTLALLSAHQLRQFGANIYAADLVAIAMVREMGPMMTAIIVAGRSGSAIAAELATMEVTEEIDALRAMGFSPVRFLVVPKLYAVTMTQPLLTAVAICFGILGGLLVATAALGVPPEAYLHRTGEVLKLNDVLTGLFKSLVFGWIILVVAAHAGLGTRGGASEVGVSTTRSVVVSIFSVIIADCIFSLLFYL
jgi:phospholipid/cholesterol/gamma-HCH transport system permease protein